MSCFRPPKEKEKKMKELSVSNTLRFSPPLPLFLSLSVFFLNLILSSICILSIYCIYMYIHIHTPVHIYEKRLLITLLTSQWFVNDSRCEFKGIQRLDSESLDVNIDKRRDDRRLTRYDEISILMRGILNVRSSLVLFFLRCFRERC